MPVPDNLNGCPNNPTKTVPDICGCDKGPMFADNIALKNAVNDYTSCLDDSNCDILTTSSYQMYGPISDWCTTGITDMSNLFDGKSSFNEPIGDWDTSSVTDMDSMFYDASNFNQAISDWDTSLVTDMWFMFGYASSFNQPIGDWDTSSVKDMDCMFYEASSFNQDLCAWSETFPYDSATNMFLDSGCTYTDTPNEATIPKGPFCASDCMLT